MKPNIQIILIIATLVITPFLSPAQSTNSSSILGGIQVSADGTAKDELLAIPSPEPLQNVPLEVSFTTDGEITTGTVKNNNPWRWNMSKNRRPQPLPEAATKIKEVGGPAPEPAAPAAASVEEPSLTLSLPLPIDEGPSLPKMSENGTYTVASGDTVDSIADAFGLTSEQLRKINWMSPTRSVIAGQVIKVNAPGMKKAAAAPAPQVSTGTATKIASTLPVADAQSAAAADDTPQTYAIQSGENPWTIAKKFGVSYQKLVEINDFSDPKRLQIGQEIKIPAKSVESATILTSASEPAFDADGHEVYVIRNGDNPWTIAQRLKVDYQELISLNQIDDPRDLKVGQKLKVPKKKLLAAQ